LYDGLVDKERIHDPKPDGTGSLAISGGTANNWLYN
jgi:hypothetical protein